MKKVLAAVLAAFILVLNVGPAVAAVEHSWSHRILHDYYSVVRKLGKRAAGRDIIHHGINTRHGVKEPTKHQKAKFQRQLRKLLNPPALMWTRATLPHNAPAGTMSAFHVAALPSCTWEHESGGDYGAVNPHSGAYGKYQILPSHWNYGSACYGLGRNPAGQEACAVRVYETEGLGAWVNC